MNKLEVDIVSTPVNMSIAANFAVTLALVKNRLQVSCNTGAVCALRGRGR